jgi:hypothetical protein
MGKPKTWPVKPVEPLDNDGQFADSYGTPVTHGTEIIIESNYNYSHFNNRPAVVEWDANLGMYRWRFTDGKDMGNFGKDFWCIHKFRVK